MPSRTRSTQRESPHSGNRSSSGTGVAVTVQPSGANSARTSSGPPRADSEGTSIRSGSGCAARSGIALHRPLSALENTRARATASSEVAAYGRSFT